MLQALVLERVLVEQALAQVAVVAQVVAVVQLPLDMLKFTVVY